MFSYFVSFFLEIIFGVTVWLLTYPAAASNMYKLKLNIIGIIIRKTAMALNELFNNFGQVFVLLVNKFKKLWRERFLTV